MRFWMVITGFALTLQLTNPAPGAAFCFEEAGRDHGVPPALLWAIAKVESSFEPAAINYNTDGSFDFGVMQINSSWAASLGPERWNRLGDPCDNVKTGAWVLADCLKRHGYTWQGVGCYNALSPEKRAEYARKVIRVLKELKQPL